jgi:hypothetical protein
MRYSMRFYLGTHETSWLGRVNVPLFVSHRRLALRRTFPVATTDWALDSGGFTELTMHGHWVTGREEYIEAVERYQAEIGRLAWAAPQDWMCEPFITDKTGLSIREHQDRTVQSYLDLRDRGPFIPVLQGWDLPDYLRCLDLYAEAGVDLTALPIVGVGSVCRRQAEGEIGVIFRALWGRGIACHGFGVKRTGLRLYGSYLASADSMAWSYQARHDRPLPGCTHKSCANCSRYALRWRDGVMNDLGWQPLFLEAA